MQTHKICMHIAHAKNGIHILHLFAMLHASQPNPRWVPIIFVSLPPAIHLIKWCENMKLPDRTFSVHKIFSISRWTSAMKKKKKTSRINSKREQTIVKDGARGKGRGMLCASDRPFHKWNGAISLITRLNYWESLNRSILAGIEKKVRCKPQNWGYTAANRLFSHKYCVLFVYDTYHLKALCIPWQRFELFFA